MSVVYGIVIILALLLFVIYNWVIKERDMWFYLLSVSIIVVNIGYFALSISKTLEEALLANRIAYLGSVFLPMAMFMIIINVCQLLYKKWLPYLLLIISICVFLLAASPGYLDIYYKHVTLERINGTSVLNKTYGSLHNVYLIFLLLYFVAMMCVVINEIIKKRTPYMQTVVLVGAVFVNLCVWMIGQFVHIEFEFLSVSYIISEFFLLCLFIMCQETSMNSNIEEHVDVNSVIEESMTDRVIENKEEELNTLKNIEHKDESNKNNIVDNVVNIDEDKLEHYIMGVKHLTPKERIIFDYYIEGKKTRDIMKELDITENTIKYHNKNIYSKLGVSSRKQLRIYAEQSM